MGKAELYSFPEMGNGGRDEKGESGQVAGFPLVSVIRVSRHPSSPSIPATNRPKVRVRKGGEEGGRQAQADRTY